MIKNIIKKDRLFYFPLNCKSLDDFIIPKIFRRFGIDYIPFSIKKYQKVFLREDKSKYCRKLVNFCKKNGIETYVVQEGIGPDSRNQWGHLPLRADYFMCPQKDYEWWVEKGMPIDRIITFIPQKQASEYSEIAFLSPIYTREDFLNPLYWEGRNIKTIKAIHFLMVKDVVFKLHNENKWILEKLIPFNRIIDGKAEDLIRSYKKIYCFSDSSIKRDCELAGVKYELIEDITK